MTEFTEANLSLEDYWRSIILYGQNVACYKFALAKSLLELIQTEKTFITLEELADPFSRYVTEHLSLVDKQITSKSSRFLDVCRKFNAGEISQQKLIDSTARLGFNNVIDAFHNVNNTEIAVRFFTDERKGGNKGITLTNELLSLFEQYQYQNLPHEVEARWRLVETAWQLNLPRNVIMVGYDEQDGSLFTANRRRTVITSCRNALNGYQKGKCFYCFANISVDDASLDLADVDHFFPHILKNTVSYSIDGIWNLVLSCQGCNRGIDGKFARIPELRYLQRLHTRNEFLIHSHHPLRETLIAQTGNFEEDRRRFLQSNYSEAKRLLIHTWKPAFENPPAF